MNKSESIKHLATALSKAQAVMSGAKKSAANPFFKSKYANLEEVIACIKEPFESNGLSFMQFPICEDDRAGVETIVMHESGEWISGSFMLKCTKLDPQGMASAITYARRYGIQSIAGIPSEDDDGNAASQAPKAPMTPAMTSKDAVARLSSAESQKDLVAVWNSFPIDIKQNADVIELKDQLKTELS
jgi:hypothetical protein